MMVEKRMRANHFQLEELPEPSPLQQDGYQKRLRLYHNQQLEDREMHDSCNYNKYSEKMHNDNHHRVQQSLHNLRINLQSQIQASHIANAPNTPLDADLMHENMITRLLEADQFLEAYHRCFTHPHECVPIPMHVVQMPEANQKNANVLFRNTPLGIACRKFNPKNDTDAYYRLSSPPRTLTSPVGKFPVRSKVDLTVSPNDIHCREDVQRMNMQTPPRYSQNQRPHQRYSTYESHDRVRDDVRLSGTGVTQMQLIRALYIACPQQIRCSQVKMGRTPLLDAMTNPNSTSELRQFIMEADRDFDDYSQLQMQMYMHSHVHHHQHMTVVTDVEMRSIDDGEDDRYSAERSGQAMPPSLTLGLPGTRPAMSTPDSNGMLPLHHLINQVRRNAIIAPENRSALESIQSMIHMCPHLVAAHLGTPKCTSSLPTSTSSSVVNSSNTRTRVEVSPLIHLLSQKVGTKHQAFMKPVVECAEMLLDENSNLVRSKSVMSKCTPLHMALRNGYDENDQLISLLLNHDSVGYQICERNIFGDLPIHVAASVGVKEETWKALLNHIIHILRKQTNKGKQGSIGVLNPMNIPSPCIWSMNKAGYTPIHLMWMKQMQGNKIQYPISTRHLGRIERRGIYFETLESAVGDIVAKIERKKFTSQSDAYRIASVTMGPFWNYLVLFLQATQMSLAIPHCFEGKVLGFDALEGKGFHFLHAACALASPLLPRPVLDLALAIFPQQVHDLDENGRTPLHYACASYLTLENEQFRIPAPNDGWKENASELPIHDQRHSDLQELIDLNPSAVAIADKYGFLPLNFAIENEKCWMKLTVHLGGFVKWCNQRSRGHCVLHCAKILKALIRANPESLAWRNPRNFFLPFMQCAAASEGHSIESIYHLLRMSPGDISCGFDKKHTYIDKDPTDGSSMELS